jgi:FkbM family methyltransferase
MRNATNVQPDSSRELFELRRSYIEGRLDRSTFRSSLSSAGVSLRRFQPLLADSIVKTIEISADEMILQLATGVRFIWTPEDIHSAPNLALLQGGYETEEFELLMDLAAGKRIVFDIGANIGWYSLHFAQKLAGADARVFSFEPIATTHARLSRNVALNGMAERVRTHCLGFSDKPGTARFFVPRKYGPSAASIQNLHPTEDSDAVVCDLESVDAFLAKEAGASKVDLVKCDVEGAELFVMRGATRLLRQDRPVFFIELLRKWARAFGYHPTEVLDLFAQHGYACWAVGKGSIRPIDTIVEETEETNFIFLNEGHEKEKAILQRHA